MIRYITLLRFTDQGAKNLPQSTSRARAFKEMATKAGVKVEGQYWTAGPYDGVLIVSGNDEKKVLRSLAELAAKGNVRTQTMRAFDGPEFKAIAGK